MNNNNPLDNHKPGVAKATWTPVDLAQAVVQAHPEWVGQPLDARLLGQALREAFGMLREQVDAVDVGTVAVPSLGRFHARRAPNKPDLRRVLFLTPKGNETAASAAPAAAPAATPVAERVEVPLAVLAAQPAAEPEAAPAAEPVPAAAEAAPEPVAAEPEAAAPAPAEPAPAKTSAKPSSKTASKSKRKR